MIYRSRTLSSVIHRVDAERAELDLVLSSRTFARTNNLGRFLGFICDKYFEGTTSEIKEYSIAVQALGRSEDFDPQLDTVVRVTAHNLRKRLELYYSTEGADHAVQICLPPGHYIPQFVHREDAGTETPRLYGHNGNGFHLLVEDTEIDSSPLSSSPEPVPSKIGFQESFASAAKRRSGRHLLIFGIVVAWALAAAAYFLWTRRPQPKPEAQSVPAPVAINFSGPQIHALIGSDREPFVDRAGNSWQNDRFCSGGSSFSASGHNILGTDDPQVFVAGRRGIFKCGFPAPPGIYEVHLLFAETSGLQENARSITFSINGAAANTMDVVDDSGGDDIATTKIFTDVAPEKDGMIHIDFNSAESFVNAIEIVPGVAHRMLPVRIVTGHSAYRDSAGNVWQPDRYFFGGRLSWLVSDLPRVADPGLFEWHRFGHFRYVIPVATGSRYTLKLYFLEHWFGIQNRGIGGSGSRVFDVYCNGSTLLKSFDIYREAASSPLIKTFPHIEPTAQGKIELSFTPVVNYPSVSAIEVIPEQ